MSHISIHKSGFSNVWIKAWVGLFASFLSTVIQIIFFQMFVYLTINESRYGSNFKLKLCILYKKWASLSAHQSVICLDQFEQILSTSERVAVDVMLTVVNVIMTSSCQCSAERSWGISTGSVCRERQLENQFTSQIRGCFLEYKVIFVCCGAKIHTAVCVYLLVLFLSSIERQVQPAAYL